MPDDNSAYMAQFQEEIRERLQNLNGLLLNLERAPTDPDLISAAFREAHTVKGLGSVVGLTDARNLSHRLEDIFVAAREGHYTLHTEAFDVCFKALDLIQASLDNPLPGAIVKEAVDQIGSLLSQPAHAANGATAGVASEVRTAAASSATGRTAVAERPLLVEQPIAAPRVSPEIGGRVETPPLTARETPLFADEPPVRETPLFREETTAPTHPAVEPSRQASAPLSYTNPPPMEEYTAPLAQTPEPMGFTPDVITPVVEPLTHIPDPTAPITPPDLRIEPARPEAPLESEVEPAPVDLRTEQPIEPLDLRTEQPAEPTTLRPEQPTESEDLTVTSAAPVELTTEPAEVTNHLPDLLEGPPHLIPEPAVASEEPVGREAPEPVAEARAVEPALEPPVPVSETVLPSEPAVTTPESMASSREPLEARMEPGVGLVEPETSQAVHVAEPVQPEAEPPHHVTEPAEVAAAPEAASAELVAEPTPHELEPEAHLEQPASTIAETVETPAPIEIPEPVQPAQLEAEPIQSEPIQPEPIQPEPTDLAAEPTGPEAAEIRAETIRPELVEVSVEEVQPEPVAAMPDPASDLAAEVTEPVVGAAATIQENIEVTTPPLSAAEELSVEHTAAPAGEVVETERTPPEIISPEVTAGERMASEAISPDMIGLEETLEPEPVVPQTETPEAQEPAAAVEEPVVETTEPVPTVVAGEPAVSTENLAEHPASTETAAESTLTDAETPTAPQPIETSQPPSPEAETPIPAAAPLTPEIGTIPAVTGLEGYTPWPTEYRPVATEYTAPAASAPGASTVTGIITMSSPVSEPQVSEPQGSSSQLQPVESREQAVRATGDYVRVSAEELDQLAAIAQEVSSHQVNEEEAIREMRDLIGKLAELRYVLSDISHQEPSGSSQVARLANAASECRDVQRSLQRFVENRLSSATEAAPKVGRLQQTLQLIRLVPLSTLFDSFPRTVRDMSHAEQKEVQLHVTGGDTRVDRKALDQIRAPLIHLLNNAVVHGIEKPIVREAAGKDRIGNVTVHAHPFGERIRILVADDGAGIDPEHLRRHAAARGMLSRMADVQDDDEAVHMIFRSGFTTSSEVTSTSGRGVGLDMVRAYLASIKGTIRVVSKPGRGTTFIVELPSGPLTGGEE